MTRALRATLLWGLVGLGGCAASFGSPRVGQWRAKRVIDTKVCVTSTTIACDRTIEVGRDVPARRFRGGLIVYGDMGYGRMSGAVSGDGYILNGYGESVIGRGRFAYSVRAGVQAGIGFGNRRVILTPIVLAGHIGGDRGALYAGLGYAPIARTYQGDVGSISESRHHNAGLAIAGSRVNLTPHLTFNPEVRYHLVGDSQLVTFTANLSLYFF